MRDLGDNPDDYEGTEPGAERVSDGDAFLSWEDELPTPQESRARTWGDNPEYYDETDLVGPEPRFPVPDLSWQPQELRVNVNLSGVLSDDPEEMGKEQMADKWVESIHKGADNRSQDQQKTPQQVIDVPSKPQPHEAEQGQAPPAADLAGSLPLLASVAYAVWKSRPSHNDKSQEARHDGQ